MSPETVITVLLSFSDIQSRCLDMAIFRRTNPYFRPGWWNSKSFNPFQFMTIIQGLVLQDISKTLPFFGTVNPLHSIPYIDQIHGIGCFLIVLIGFEQFFMGKGKDRFVHFLFFLFS